MQERGSRDVAQAALRMVITTDREEETTLKSFFEEKGIKVAATDFGGEFLSSINKIVERTVAVAKREGVIGETHAEEGSVAGAAHEAITQIVQKAAGLNIGGKIACARFDDHIVVAVFFGIGMLHLNEVAIGLGHRVV